MDYKVTVYATRDGVERKFESNTAAAKAFGRSESQMRRELWYYNACIDGWKFRVVRRDAAMKAAVTAQRKGVDLELRRLKHIPHDPIHGLTDPQSICGWAVRQRGVYQRDQRDPLESHRSPSGTSATFSSPSSNNSVGTSSCPRRQPIRGSWTLYRIPGKPFLESIRPMLLEKGKQVDLVLKMTDDGARVNYELRKLKGNYTPAAHQRDIAVRARGGARRGRRAHGGGHRDCRGEAVVAPTVA